MTCILSDTKITGFQPKQEKDKETKEVLDKLVIKGEAKLDNSLQISELFTGFRKKMIKASFSPYDDVEGDFTLSSVTLEDFAVKNKMEKIGEGKEAERIPVEHAYFTLTIKMDDDGELLKKMYSIFQKNIKMELE
ncbi:hypothetical protein JXJ21_04575 [candidate division KSB1 bacterium]|nr:hypothetical protein [candidate division KSB1 bacterium]